MDIRADFAQRAVVHTATVPWVPSPVAGVERKMLDRIGGEVARATSLVRYAPGSRFSPHAHAGGEEFLVLEGVFQDERGDYPTGAYVRNAPGSRHTPGSAPGCTILVKLWQFKADDRLSLHVDTRGEAFVQTPGRAGVSRLALYQDDAEDVRIERWHAGAALELVDAGGIELLVLEGGFVEHGERFGGGSWLRLPPDAVLAAQVGTEGARVWIKTGHLRGLVAENVRARLAGSPR